MCLSALIAGGLGLAGDIFNGLNQKKGAKDAANAQVAAAQAALALQQKGYDLQQSGMDRVLGLQKQGQDQSLNLQKQGLNRSLGFMRQGATAIRNNYGKAQGAVLPWLSAGKAALAQLQRENGLAPGGSNFHATPGYQFQVDEGQKGVMNNLAALGMKNSGSALKALTRFREGLADQEYNNYYNRIAGVADAGQHAADQSAALYQNEGNALGGQYTTMGNTFGNAYNNMGTTITNTAGNMGNTITNTTNGMANTLGNMAGTLQDIGAYRASGYAGRTNALTGMVNGVTNTLGNSLGYLNNQFPAAPGGLY